ASFTGCGRWAQEIAAEAAPTRSSHSRRACAHQHVTIRPMTASLPPDFIAMPGDTGASRAVLVGLSGGLDSVALLHLLCSRSDVRAAGLRAIHVHHGLQAAADDWAVHCRALCEALDIPLQVIDVDVERDSGAGLEAAARAARRRAFAAALRDDEVLALAHHRDDQAETFLLRALRASGPDGLARSE